MSNRFDRVAYLTWGFVGLGVLVRLVRYLVVYPIWHDEAFLAVNFLDRGYLDLLRPLDYSQVSPILFLWIELTAVRLLGFSEWSLRLFPALCGLMGVFLFRYVASRLLRGTALVFAVAVFATAFYPIRHSAEVKPYASDLFAALVLLGLAVNWWLAPGQSRWWWVLCVVAPVLLALSYPAIFVAAGVSVALGTKALEQPAAKVRLGYLVYNVIVAASFISLYFACTFMQATALRSFYRVGYWRDSFPPWQEPWRLPGWLIGVHTGTTMAYPIGGERGASILTLIAVLAGTIVLYRGRRAVILRLLLAPCAMGLAAAFLGRYPYGGAPRITQYLVPSICLLGGLGGAFLVSRLPSPRWRRRSLGLAAGLFAAIGISLIARDLIEPYRVRSDEVSRRFARRFWAEDGKAFNLVCVKSDLGMNFQPRLWRSGMSAVYLFHRGAYAHPHERRGNRRFEGMSLSEKPIRLVFFDDLPRGHSSFEPWLAKLHPHERIPAPKEVLISRGKPGEDWLRERYVVLDLVREPAVASEVSRSLNLFHERR
jgi:hypothetical protein